MLRRTTHLTYYLNMLRKLEREYLKSLRKIARHVADIVRGYPAGDPTVEPAIRHALTGYANVIDGWARLTAAKFIAGAAREDDAAWRARSAMMGRELQREIRNAPTGETMRRLQAEQVDLIKSIPLDEAQRVHRLTLTGIENGGRASQVAAEIMRSNEVTANRARLIARTETSRTSTLLTQARALHVGSVEYIWRSSGDSDVRKEHREVNGKVFRWDSPPTFDDGHSYAPGCFPNCRCWAEPIIPE